MSDTGMIDLGNFATGADQIKPSDGFAQIPPDTYEYEVSEGPRVVNGTKNNPNTKYLTIKFQLSNGMAHTEWYAMPATFGAETQKERDTIARYLRRLVDLGIPSADANKPLANDALAGYRGVLTIVATKGKDGKDYRNVRDVRPNARASAPQQSSGRTAPDPERPQAAQIPPSTGGAGSNPFANQ